MGTKVRKIKYYHYDRSCKNKSSLRDKVFFERFDAFVFACKLNRQRGLEKSI
jgi:hypothetical protein